MKIAEVRKLDDKKLHETLAELRNKSRELRFSIANNQLKHVRSLRVVKHDIAKVLTVINERRLSADAQPKEEPKKEEKK